MIPQLPFSRQGFPHSAAQQTLSAAGLMQAAETHNLTTSTPLYNFPHAKPFLFNQLKQGD